MKTATLFIFSLFVLLTAFGSVAEAAYVYGSYGSGYSSPYALERGQYYNSYPTNSNSYNGYNGNSNSYPARTNVYDESFSYPRGSGSLYSMSNRDSALEMFSNTQNTDRSNKLNERFTDNSFGTQAQYNRNMLDLSQQTSYNQAGTNFNGGSSQYRYGDCSSPSYERTLHGDYKGSRNDFTITETICGGEQVNLQKNFGTTNTYANTLTQNQRSLQDSFTGGVATRNTNTDRTTATQDTQQVRNSVSYQKSSFGQGYQLVFN